MYIKADDKGIKRTSEEKSWRLIHDGIQVIDLVEQDFVIQTGGTSEIFVSDKKEECEAEIARLNLELPERLKEKK